MPRRCLLLMVSVAILSCQLSCASGPDARARVSYRTSAKENFIKGKKALEDEDYLEAMEYFKFVKNKFPYSTYAAEADLFLADCHFGRERFIEAADAYRNFNKLHPKHAKVPYAMFRIGMCFFNRIPDDWWFAPPAYELDQAETAKAIRELQRYLRLHPQDENAEEAKKHLEQCLRRMADRVYYVMQFYLSRDHPRAVLWRAKELLNHFAGLGFDEEAMYRKGEALHKLGEVDDAQSALELLLKKFPQGDYASKARRRLDELKTETAKPEVGAS